MPRRLGAKFMRQTRYSNLGPSDQQLGLPQPPLELARSGLGESIELPAPRDLALGDVPLRRVIDQRRSVRAYAKAPLSLAELSHLLWCTQGVQRVLSTPATLRTVPSAGARHALETHLLVNRVEGLEPGLYRFLAGEHRLLRADVPGGIHERIHAGCLEQDMVLTCAATFVWTAVPYRMAWRYGDRGYRYLHLDAGHVCQNLYLAAEAIGAGVCAIAAFDDAVMDEALGIDGEEEFTLYVATVGRKR
jgi:SagB-type dehydrogenase family enzyme